MEGLEKALDQSKIGILTHKFSTFYGSILAQLAIDWSQDIPTACVDGKVIQINPDFFMSLTKDQRKTLVMHEVRHVAQLHFTRGKSKDAGLWNQACDYRINNDMVLEGFVKIDGGCYNSQYDSSGIMAEEDIYDLLVESGAKAHPTDMVPSDGEAGSGDEHLGIVTSAMQTAYQGSGAGSVPGDIVERITDLLSPIIPWEGIIANWLKNKISYRYSMARPRRNYVYQGLYLPHRQKLRQELEKIIWYIDTSGSMESSELLRIFSEASHVYNTFRPPEMSLVQFDTRVTQETHFHKGDTFQVPNVHGRGGTSLVPVRNHINKHKPSCVIIFSDLDCTPMVKPEHDADILWIVVRGNKKTVPFGTMHKIKERISL